MHADVLYENGNSRTVIKNGILSHRPILIIDKRVCKDSSNSSVASSNDNDDKIILDISESSSAGEAIIEEQHVNEFQVIFSKLEQDGKKVTLLVNINEDWVEVSLSVSNLILLQDGYRVTKAGKIKFGSMGVMTSPKCAECIARPGYDWDQVGGEEMHSKKLHVKAVYLFTACWLRLAGRTRSCQGGGITRSPQLGPAPRRGAAALGPGREGGAAGAGARPEAGGEDGDGAEGQGLVLHPQVQQDAAVLRGRGAAPRRETVLLIFYGC